MHLKHNVGHFSEICNIAWGVSRRYGDFKSGKWKGESEKGKRNPKYLEKQGYSNVEN